MSIEQQAVDEGAEVTARFQYAGADAALHIRHRHQQHQAGVQRQQAGDPQTLLPPVAIDHERRRQQGA